MMKNYNDHSCRILTISGSGSGKTNVLLSLIRRQQPDIDKALLIHQKLILIKVSIAINGTEKVSIKAKSIH